MLIMCNPNLNAEIQYTFNFETFYAPYGSNRSFSLLKMKT